MLQVISASARIRYPGCPNLLNYSLLPDMLWDGINNNSSISRSAARLRYMRGLHHVQSPAYHYALVVIALSASVSGYDTSISPTASLWSTCEASEPVDPDLDITKGIIFLLLFPFMVDSLSAALLALVAAVSSSPILAPRADGLLTATRALGPGSMVFVLLNRTVKNVVFP